MRPSEVLPKHRDAIRQIVLQSGMANPRLFGSVIHGDDIDGSDLDLLIDAPPKASLFDIAKVQVAIEDVVGIRVDLLTPDCLPPKFREKILSEAVPV
jgi:predicted nucleotidyltransferase